MTTTKAKAAVKANKVEPIIAQDELSNTPEIANESPATEEGESVEAKERRCNILLQRFTSEDLRNKNPRIFERLYKTFEPMGIQDNPDAIYDLLTDYNNWLDTVRADLEAKAKREKEDAIERLKAIAEKAGIDLASLT